MLARLNHTRLLRYAGLFTWGLVGCWLLSIWLDPSYLQLEPDQLPTLIDVRILRWLLVYLTFGAVYWWITRALGQRQPGFVDHALLLVLTACAIGVGFFSGSGLGSALLMVMAGLLPWLLPLRVGVAWLVVGNLAIIPVFVEALEFPILIAVMQSLLYMGFSSFVFVTALVAKQQAQARDEQGRLN
ncbi:MAG TPA: sensor histidine kinase, partial [Lysobacter sp.]